MLARIRQSINNFPLVVYYLLAYAFTWIGSLIYHFTTADGGLKLPPLLNFPGALIWYYGPCLAAIIVTTIKNGKTGLFALFRRLLLWRVGWRWYAFILLYPLALHLLVVTLDWLLGGPAPRFFEAEDLPQGNICLTLLGLMLVHIFLRGIGEETGWRGFALPQMETRWSAFSASLLLGFLWALWHFHPANLSALLSISGIFIFINIFSTSVLFTWVYNHTRGSILVAILFHMTLNVSEYVVPIGLTNATRTAQFIQITLIWLVIAILLLRFGPRLGSQNLPEEMLT